MDNKFFKFNCPAKMDKSNLFTNYYQSNDYEKYMQEMLGAKDSRDYRYKLQQNAEDIMKNDMLKQMNKLCKCNNYVCNTPFCEVKDINIKNN